MGFVFTGINELFARPGGIEVFDVPPLIVLVLLSYKGGMFLNSNGLIFFGFIL